MVAAQQQACAPAVSVFGYIGCRQILADAHARVTCVPLMRSTAGSDPRHVVQVSPISSGLYIVGAQAHTSYASLLGSPSTTPSSRGQRVQSCIVLLILHAAGHNFAMAGTQVLPGARRPKQRLHVHTHLRTYRPNTRSGGRQPHTMRDCRIAHTAVWPLGGPHTFHRVVVGTTAHSTHIISTKLSHQTHGLADVPCTDCCTHMS